MAAVTVSNQQFHSLFIDRIRDRQEKIQHWLGRYAQSHELPLYSSVDIRDSGAKIAVVDTNLFPAGFNNLCEHGIADAVLHFAQAIRGRVPQGKNIVIIAEEHTRNTWYLENVRVLRDTIAQAGFNVRIATFLDIQPAFCQDVNYVELRTATDRPVKVYCLQNLINGIKSGQEQVDLIILNNDLTSGIPEFLEHSPIPIYPSLRAGWHSRLKSHHFSHTNDLIREFAKIVDLDPWFFSCAFRVEDEVDINAEPDRKRLRDSAAGLFEQIRRKYGEHGINEKPYLVVKSDSGTYGMGVLAVENPDDILRLNRRDRNKLKSGKGSRVNERYLLQEGVPTIYHIENQVSEVCIYQVEDNLVGGFYRSHAGKGSRDNLNSRGMGFQKMCPHSRKYGDCGVHHDVNIFDVYRILARIASIAAHREIAYLEDNRS